MKSTQWLRATITGCGIVGALLLGSGVNAELKPGDTLDQTRWQEAKGMMPEAILSHFENGQHRSTIIELPKDALQWSSRFKAATEVNQGKYEVNDKGILIEKATGSYPRFGYGLPFAQIDATDPQAPYKIMYNFFRTLVQWDDINVLVNFFWTTPDVLDRYVDFRGQALSYGSRWSAPIANPDEVAAKVLIYGTAPYDVVGLATLDWNYLDPERWRSVWTFVPIIRRVRHLSAANSSDGVFGSHLSRDDFGIFAGRIHHFNWKFIGEKEVLVPYTLPTPKIWEPTVPQGLVLPANETAAVMPWPGRSKLNDQRGQK